MLRWTKNALLTIASLSLAFHLSFETVVSQDALAQSADMDNVQKAFKKRLELACKERNLPGIWAGKFHVNGSSRIEVAGKRKWSQPDKAEADDIVHLGSCTKAMTAVLIGQLCTEGKLQLETPLKEIFTDLPKLAESDWGNVTVRELMQHRSGLVANVAWHDLDKLHPHQMSAARQVMLERVCDMKRPKSPKFVYSNVGFALLGHIAEHLEKKPWEEIIHERLFDRLDMRSAHFGPVGKPDGHKGSILSDRAWGHTETNGLASLANSFLGGSPSKFDSHQIDNARTLGPAGRAHMNLPDWSRFVLLFAREDGYKELGISKEIWESMLTPSEGSKGNEKYAAGWILFDKTVFGDKTYFHNGSNTTWYCYAVAAPEKGYCVLVATNVFSNSAMQACDEVAKYLATIEE